MLLLDVGYFDPWGSLSSGPGFLIGWGHCFETELHWEKVNEAQDLLLNRSWQITTTQSCTTHSIHIKLLSLKLWLYCITFCSSQSHIPANSDVLPPLTSMSSRSKLHPHNLWQHVLYKWHVRFHTHAVLHSCLATQSQAALKGSTEEARGRSRGCSAWCVW